MYAVVLKGQGRLEEAYPMLDGLRIFLEKAGLNNLLLKVLTQEALIADTLGEEDQSLILLQRALQLAEPEGYIWVFISKGARMEKLLRKAVSAGISPGYARMLLEKCAGQVGIVPMVQPGLAGDGKETSPLIEPLSERELEVLRLLNTSLDSTEIAAKLFISVSTARTHIKNIYSKLNVNRRLQAVERAHDLNLL